jgi:serine O-acetyltransferase
MRSIFVYILLPRVIFADLLYLKSKKVWSNSYNIAELIDEDIKKYLPQKLRDNHKSQIFKLNYLLIKNKTFRNIFYYRIQQEDILSKSMLRHLSYCLIKPLENIEIGTKDNGHIEGGLKIMHSSGCVIVPYKAGKNLTIFQGVTIGDGLKTSKRGKRNPEIGNNVTIMPNSVVAGGILIGNNVTIGAGSVILKDVPSNCTVVGNPARIVKKDGKKVSILL